jgi:hypothetical protein
LDLYVHYPPSKAESRKILLTERAAILSCNVCMWQVCQVADLEAFRLNQFSARGVLEEHFHSDLPYLCSVNHSSVAEELAPNVIGDSSYAQLTLECWQTEEISIEIADQTMETFMFIYDAGSLTRIDPNGMDFCETSRPIVLFVKTELNSMELVRCFHKF